MRSRTMTALGAVVLSLACSSTTDGHSNANSTSGGTGQSGGAAGDSTSGATSTGGAEAMGGTFATGGVSGAGASATGGGGQSTGGGAGTITGGAAGMDGGAMTGGSSGAGGVGGAGSAGTAGKGGAGAGGSAGKGGAGSGGMNTGGNGGKGGSPSTGLIGWASVSQCGPNGTTGGGNGTPTITVTNTAQLEDALGASGPRVIAVSGTIQAPESISDVIDKTLVGMSNAEIEGGLTLRESRNVVIKNIVFSDGEGGSGDSLEVSLSQCIWIDHSEFRDGSDGNLDIVRQSDFVTVSWSRFYYTRGHDHMLSNLGGNGQPVPEDEGKINITFHHNWWGAGVKERMPRVRYGKVHIFNNYYHHEAVPNDTGQSYAIGAGFHSKLLVENNYFDGTKDPIIFQVDEDTAQVAERGNEFVSTTGGRVSRGASFTPPYGYTMDAGAQVKAIVMAGAGRK